MKELTSSFEMALDQNESLSYRKKYRYIFNRLQIIENELRQILTFHPKEWISAFRYNALYPIFVRGDIDGFVALFINNLATLLAVILSLQPILGNEIVYGKIVPG